MPAAKKTTAKKAAPKPSIGDQADAAYEAIAEQIHTDNTSLAGQFHLIQPCTTQELADACGVRTRIAQIWLINEATSGRIQRDGGVWFK